MQLPTFTLLIVEDFLTHRDLYRHCLLTDPICDYQVLEAESIAEGLELCRTRSIDAILLDYSLPDGDGLEFLAALAAQRHDLHVPSVVMMTGHGNEGIAVRAMKLGAQDYLAKHKFTPELLRSTVHSAIENVRLRLQLQQREERFRASVENMLECFGIYSAIRDGSGQIRDFRFDYLNAAALKSNHMTSADLDRGLCEVFPAIRETGLFAEYCHVVETGTSLVKEDLVCSDTFGGKRLTRAYNIQIGKLDDGFVASWQDITEQQAALCERKQAEIDLAQRNQELDSFVHVVSHDLKAPLRAIANLSQWIEEDFQGAISAHSQQQMTLLRSRVHSMEAKIDGLLDYARVGKTDAKIELVATVELVAEVVETLAPAPTFTISISPDLPTLSANRLLLSQVFANTIGNAIEHHDRVDGSITISCQVHNNFYEFAIADDGVGIAPEHHERIFRIFQAVNPQNRSDSTGIGLAIVKKIVEAEGGTIWLKSQLGKGTTFYFTWPKQG
jgi:CheY-like chemotaxis protein/nitrogen-specific signal transduction histidine kinase